MAIDLSAYEAAFNEAQSAEEKAAIKGKMEARILAASLAESKAGNPYVKWELVVQGGAFDKRRLWKNQNIKTKENCAYLKRDLQTCGEQIAKIADLPAVLERMAGKVLAITVKPRGDNQDIYFDKLLGKVEESVAPAVEDKKDTIPF